MNFECFKGKSKIERNMKWGLGKALISSNHLMHEKINKIRKSKRQFVKGNYNTAKGKMRRKNQNIQKKNENSY